MGVVRYNSAGTVHWSAIHNGTANGDDKVNASVVDASGNIYVTGVAVNTSSGADYATIKYNSTGVRQWVALYNGTGNGSDEARSIAVDNSGNVYVTGSSRGPAGMDYATVKYNLNGTQQWVKRYNGPLNAADDAICLKSDDRNRRCENIYIADCRLRSSANAVKLGTASHGGFKNITIRNIEVYDTYRSAIALEAVDGGEISNIDVRNIRAVNTGNAFFIRLGHRNKDSVYSKVSDIRISDMRVQVPAGKPDKGYRTEGPLLKYPPGFKKIPGQLQSVSPWNHSWNDSTAVIYEHNVFPSSVAGLPGHLVKNVLLENIEIIYAGGGDSTVNYFPVSAARELTNAVSDYPEFSMFGELPAWGLFIRYASGVTMKNIRLVQQQPDYRTGLLVLESTGIEAKKIQFECPRITSPVQLINAGHHTFRKIRMNQRKIKVN